MVILPIAIIGKTLIFPTTPSSPPNLTKTVMEDKLLVSMVLARLASHTMKIDQNTGGRQTGCVPDPEPSWGWRGLGTGTMDAAATLPLAPSEPEKEGDGDGSFCQQQL